MTNDDPQQDKEKRPLSPLATWLSGEVIRSRQQGLTAEQWKDEVRARHGGQAEWLDAVIEEFKRAGLWPWE